MLTTEKSHRTRPLVLVLALLAASSALALVLYWPTLGASYAYDDIDYFNSAADVLAGKSGFWEYALRPQGEHLVPCLRVLWLLNAMAFGVFSTPLRLLALLSHAATGAMLGILAYRYSGHRSAAYASALSYVGVAGFSSMWIWFPSGTTVVFAIAAFVLSALVVAYGDRLGWTLSRCLAAALLVVALGFDTTHVPLVSMPMVLDLWERRNAGRRPLTSPFFVLCLLLMLTTVAAASYFFSHSFGRSISLNLVEAVPKALFLILVAPFRLLFPGFTFARAAQLQLPLPVVASLCGLVVGLTALIWVLSLWRDRQPRLAAVALLLGLGPLGIIALVGLGRWQTSYFDLLFADRYFFTLMIPISLLIGAAASSAMLCLERWSRWQRAVLSFLLLSFFVVEFTLHRTAMLERIPFAVYARHEKVFDQLERLNELLSEELVANSSGEQPVHFPDSDLCFPEVHNGRLSARFLLHVIGHEADHRLVLGPERVAERDAAVLNPVLVGWAKEIGEPLPYLKIVDGYLVDHHVVSRVDFRSSPGEEVVLGGFYQWEDSFRWMSEGGQLRLTMREPGLSLVMATLAPELARVTPDFDGIPVRVALRDERTKLRIELGEVLVDDSSPKLYRIDTTPFGARFGNGRVVILELTSGLTWRPEDVLEGSRDRRELSVQVLAAGFGQLAASL